MTHPTTPHVTNPGTPDELTRGVCLVSDMQRYPSLLRLRPPRTDLYSRILQASPENRLRLTYSFAVDYLRLGSNSIFLRQGLMLQLHDPAGESFIIFSPVSEGYDVTKKYNVVPVKYDADYVTNFCMTNADYVTTLNGIARVAYVREGYVILTPT